MNRLGWICLAPGAAVGAISQGPTAEDRNNLGFLDATEDGIQKVSPALSALELGCCKGSKDGDGDDSDQYAGTDCDDTDGNISPLELETWYDGIDQNCDGLSDYDQDADGYDSLDY